MSYYLLIRLHRHPRKLFGLLLRIQTWGKNSLPYMSQTSSNGHRSETFPIFDWMSLECFIFSWTNIIASLFEACRRNNTTITIITNINIVKMRDFIVAAKCDQCCRLNITWDRISGFADSAHPTPQHFFTFHTSTSNVASLDWLPSAKRALSLNI